MSELLFIIDRFEDEWAVVEYGDKTFNVPRTLIGPDITEGDVIDIKIVENKIETNSRKKLIEKLSNKLFKE